MIRAALIISVSLFYLSAAGQSETSLSLLVDRALRANYDIAVYKIDETIADEYATPGNAGFLPSVNIAAEQSRSVNDTRQQFFNGEVREGSGANSTNLNAFARVDWTVFDGFGMFARRDRFAALQEISVVSTRLLIEETLADLSDLYFQLIYERSLLASYQSTIEVSRFRYNLEEERFRAGASDKLTVNQAGIDYQADSIRLVSQLSAIRDLEIQLNLIINQKPEEQISPATTEVLPTGKTYAEWLEAALSNGESLKMADLELVVADAEAKMNRAVMYPQVGLFAQYSFLRQENEIGFLQSNRNAGLQYGLSVRFNLFDGGRTRTLRDVSELEREKTAIARDRTRAVVESAVSAQHNRLQYLLWQKDLATQRLVLAEQNIEIARQQLQSGAISGFDFRQSQLSVLQARNELAGINLAIAVGEMNLHRLAGGLMSKVMSL